MIKQLTFEKILFRSYMQLILIAALLISIFSAGVDAVSTFNNGKQNMYESLKQAQININNHTQMIADYLTLTQADSSLRAKLKALTTAPSMPLLTEINDTLFSVDLFKKNLESMQIFAYDDRGFIPDFSSSGQYSNALFSAKSVKDEEWFQNTLDFNGATYWFIDSSTFKKPTLCAARVLYDVSNIHHILGVIKANVSVEKLIRHLRSLSFGEKGYAFLMTDQLILYTDSRKPENIAEALPQDEQHFHNHFLLVKFPIITEGWQVAGIISKWELYKNTFQNLLLIGLVSVLTLLLAAFISRKNSQRISYPILRLCKHMLLLKEVETTDVPLSIEIHQLYDTYNEMLSKNEALIRSREETLLKFKQAEMAALQSQMNPHFIYNTLESINALISIGDNAHAAQMTTDLGSFLRSSLNNGNPYITLENEIKQVSSYVQIQKLRYSNKLELFLDIPDPIPDYRIIKLILQPLVENSIIHGFKDFEDTGKITISVKETKDALLLSVADNGWGSDIEMLNYLVKQRTLYKEDNVNFYCIQNVYQRLTNCYGKECSLTYSENRNGGVTATINISKSVLQGGKTC